MSLAEKQRALIEDLAIIDNPQERLSVIVDRFRRAAPLAAAEKTDAHRVTGCISAVWLLGEFRDGVLHLRVDADSPLVKGLVGLLCQLYDGAPPAEILALEPALFTELGLDRHLSPTRRNGLAAVRARIRELARAHL